MDEEHALAFALETTRRAGDIARRLFGNVRTEYKESGVPYDVVTEADREIDAFVINAVKAAFPDHGFHSEEGGGEQGARFRWTLDPVDGSSNFARGIPHFAICLGLLDGGVPVCGVVYDPITEDLFAFSKDSGALLNGTRMSASAAHALAGGTLLLTIGSRKENWTWGTELYKRLLESEVRVRNLGSSALDICFLAAGRVDAVVYGGMTLADVAPAVGILRAAGGEVYAFDTGKVAELLTTPQRVLACGDTALRDRLLSLHS